MNKIDIMSLVKSKGISFPNNYPNTFNGCEVETGTYKYNFFITSEYNIAKSIRRFSIRHINLKTERINTLVFAKYSSLKSCEAFLEKFILSLDRQISFRERLVLENLDYIMEEDRYIQFVSMDNDKIGINLEDLNRIICN